MKLSTLFLTCAHKAEADKITNALLEKGLAACVKQTPVSSAFLWEGKIQKSEEILLLIDTTEKRFNDIDKVVATLHSYDTYVLTAVPITKTTPTVQKWIESVTGEASGSS